MLIKYLPEYMRKINEIKRLMEVEQQDFDKLIKNIKGVQSEMFVETANEYGIKRFEKMLGIKGVNGESIDLRRFRVLLKLTSNERVFIKERLDSLIGSESYRFSLDINFMRLEVRVMVESKEYLDEVKELLDRFVPCNIVLDVSILYASHKMLSKYTHGQLADYMHSELKLIGIE